MSDFLGRRQWRSAENSVGGSVSEPVHEQRLRIKGFLSLLHFHSLPNGWVDLWLVFCTSLSLGWTCHHGEPLISFLSRWLDAAASRRTCQLMRRIVERLPWWTWPHWKWRSFHCERHMKRVDSRVDSSTDQCTDEVATRAVCAESCLLETLIAAPIKSLTVRLKSEGLTRNEKMKSLANFAAGVAASNGRRTPGQLIVSNSPAK